MKKANIRRIKFSNFYSFKNETEVFFTAEDKYSSEKSSWNLIESKTLGGEKILPVTVFYGANASGKSNLLQAFKCFSSLLNRKDKKSPKMPYRPFALSKNQPSNAEIEFILNDDRYCYAISHDNTAILSEKLFYYPTVSGKEKVIFERIPTKFSSADPRISEIVKNEINDHISTRQDVLALEILRIREIEPFNNVYKFFDNLGGPNEDYMNIGKVLHNDAELKQKVVDLLKYADIGICDIETKKIESKKDDKILDFEAKLKRLFGEFSEDIEFELTKAGLDGDTNVEYHYEFKHNCDGKDDFLLHPSQESRGTTQYLNFLMQFLPAFVNGGLFVIDEPSHLHSILLQDLIKLFHNSRINKAGAQLIFTTHDVSIMIPENLRRDEIWFVEKDGNTGISDAYPLSIFNDIRKGYDYSKGYLQGKFGGIPFLGNIDKLQSIQMGDENGKKKIVSE
ncbi:MAG: ATP-binding protein [Alphaproteobacteria bacterium]|nr:ATP-binding protein [Alphaproteobacteria bacterium]MCL2890003.1 ATP-binding protein [Alphaproteobacteria bacterium]